MANTSSTGSAPGGHGGRKVSGSSGAGNTASSDKQRAADIAATNRQAGIARSRTAAQKARAKTAAGPLGQNRIK